MRGGYRTRVLIRLLMFVVLLVSQQAPAADHAACAAFNPDCATAGDDRDSDDDERTVECESFDGEDSDESSLSSQENIVAEFTLAPIDATMTRSGPERSRLLRPPRA